PRELRNARDGRAVGRTSARVFRATATMNNTRLDPPMRPSTDSAVWFESDSELLHADPDLALLIVRVGMASNALAAQLHAGQNAAGSTRSAAVRSRDINASFLTTTAVTFEAVRVAQNGMVQLRPLAREAGASEDLLRRIGQLCAG